LGFYPYIGIQENEFADFLANTTKHHVFTGLTLCPYPDLIPVLRKAIFKLWHIEWSNLSISYATKYKQSVPFVTNKVWFIDLPLNRDIITKFWRLFLNHNTLPKHAYKLGLNDSFVCLFPNWMETICDFDHLVFHCPALSDERQALQATCSSFQISMIYSNLLLFNNDLKIKAVLNLILNKSLIV